MRGEADMSFNEQGRVRIVIVSAVLDFVRSCTDLSRASVVLCMVSRERLHSRILKVIGNPGGANEAVIRMLISIGRCVARSRTRSVSLNGFRQPWERSSFPRIGEATRKSALRFWSPVSVTDRLAQMSD